MMSYNEMPEEKKYLPELIPKEAFQREIIPKEAFEKKIIPKEAFQREIIPKEAFERQMIPKEAFETMVACFYPTTNDYNIDIIVQEQGSHSPVNAVRVKNLDDI
jgi:hypothetical protein